jgi:hypothetical protein
MALSTGLPGIQWLEVSLGSALPGIMGPYDHGLLAQEESILVSSQTLLLPFIILSIDTNNGRHGLHLGGVSTL